MGRTFIGGRPTAIAALVAIIGALLILGAAAPAHAAGDDAAIEVDFTCTSVAVTSSKDISNIVVEFADGSTQRFEGLSGHDWARSFEQEVVGVWVKSGNNGSGDGPGYGGRWDSDARCGTSPSDSQTAPERETKRDEKPATSAATRETDRGPEHGKPAPKDDVPAEQPDADVAAADDVEEPANGGEVSAKVETRGPSDEVVGDADEADVSQAPAPSGETAVLGVAIERPVIAAGPEAQAAGVQLQAAPSALARTGANAGWLLAIAMALSVYGLIALDLTGRRAGS